MSEAKMHKVPQEEMDTAEELDVPDFGLPVDSEMKSKVLRLWSFNRPHHMAFHLAWLGFFTAFTSTFAAAPLITIIRQDINLTKSGISGANVASVCGAIFSRIAMGSFTDAFGPRMGFSALLSLTSSAVFLMSMVTTSAGFIVTRCVIGFSLATFVCCQYWCTAMFSPNVVGTANAFAGGWGNLGGGFTQLMMPYLFKGFADLAPDYQAWRWAFFVPGAMHVLVALLVILLGQDLPGGSFAELKRKGSKDKASSHREFMTAILNYRTWILLFTYGYCFGVELTIDNNLAEYFADHFGKGIVAAGNLAAIFGLLNIFSRPAGGWISDLCGRRWGMRGRLWWLFICQMLGGLTCIALGLAQDTFAGTMVVVVLFSIFVQGACGASFGVVPFVSMRARGLVYGFVGAGGNTGGAITQAIFFTPQSLATADALKWLGCMICGCTMMICFLWWPQWGGMFCGPKAGVTEEDYYYAEWSAAEREAGKHLASSKFANESKSQRGFKRLAADAEQARKFEQHV
jgi:NNP family nitrate/nitrite transporter-like MFS transporter